MRKVLVVLASLFAMLLGVTFLVGGIGGLLDAGGHPEVAGRGRIHDAKTVETPCQRIEGICSRDYDVQLDKPDGETETLDNLELFTKVQVRGPLAVEVEWDSKLHDASRVRVDGRWVRVAHPEGANVFESVLGVLGGLVLGGFGLLVLAGTLGRQAEPEPTGA